MTQSFETGGLKIEAIENLDPAHWHDVLLDGRLDTLISYFQGLTIRALYRPNMDRASLVDAFRIAMRALLMT